MHDTEKDTVSFLLQVSHTACGPACSCASGGVTHLKYPAACPQGHQPAVASNLARSFKAQSLTNKPTHPAGLCTVRGPRPTPKTLCTTTCLHARVPAAGAALQAAATPCALMSREALQKPQSPMARASCHADWACLGVPQALALLTECQTAACTSSATHRVSGGLQRRRRRPAWWPFRQHC